MNNVVGEDGKKGVGTKRRRVVKSGADEVLEDEDAEEEDVEEDILRVETSSAAGEGATSRHARVSRRRRESRLSGNGHRHPEEPGQRVGDTCLHLLDLCAASYIASHPAP
nr:hypothetical protein B0A51_14186 [Rachicladosporium sp. CCFEE 5018]